MIRLLDIIFSFLSLILFFPLFILIFLVGFLDTGFPLFIQKRVGLNLKNFTLIKFRTMKMGTLFAGTHLIDKSNITRHGYFLRKFKLDELPQLLNVLLEIIKNNNNKIKDVKDEYLHKYYIYITHHLNYDIFKMIKYIIYQDMYS